LPFAALAQTDSRSALLQFFREELMRELPLYQEIIQTGMQQGEQRIVMRQLTRRIGEVSPQLQAQIQPLLCRCDQPEQQSDIISG
jgi:predicted transposase YdaD